MCHPTFKPVNAAIEALMTVCGVNLDSDEWRVILLQSEEKRTQHMYIYTF